MSVVCGGMAGAADSKFLNQPVTFESESSDSNRMSKLRRSLVISLYAARMFVLELCYIFMCFVDVAHYEMSLNCLTWRCWVFNLLFTVWLQIL